MSAQVVALRPAGQSKPDDDVLIHVRFHPNAAVFMIDKRPEHLTPGDWLARLWEAAPSHYLGLSGGRGFFRIPRNTFDAIVSRL
jgi:hypothetical protein